MSLLESSSAASCRRDHTAACLQSPQDDVNANDDAVETEDDANANNDSVESVDAANVNDDSVAPKDAADARRCRRSLR